MQDILSLALLALGPTGAAYVGVKTALNGTAANVRDIKAEVTGMRRDLDSHGNRLTALETKLEAK